MATHDDPVLSALRRLPRLAPSSARSERVRDRFRSALAGGEAAAPDLSRGDGSSEDPTGRGLAGGPVIAGMLMLIAMMYLVAIVAEVSRVLKP